MKRWICAFVALLMTASLATGCSKAKSKPSSSGEDESNASSSSQQASGAAADGAVDLVVYSPLPQTVVDAAVAGFQESTGKRVNVVCDSADVLAQRIASPKAGEPAADVLFGAGAELVEQYAVYFQSYQSPESASIVEEFQSGDHLWTALSPMPIVIMYNKTNTSKAPAGWETLSSEAYGGAVAFADPELSGTSYTALFAMEQAIGGGTDVYEAVDVFAKNLEGNLMNGVAEVYAAIEKGDFSAGVTLESSAQKYLDAGYGEKVGYIFPSEGTVAALEVSAITANAAHKDAAGEFIDYVTSEAFQVQLAELFYMRGVRTDTPVPTDYTELSEIKLVPYSPKSAIAARQETLDRFKTAYQEGVAEPESSSQAG